MLHQSSFQCIRGRKDPNSYRAVTVTSVITKCFEFVLLEGLQPIPEDTVFLPLWVKLKKMYGIHDQETTLLTYCITHRKSSALNHSDRVSSELCNLGYEYAAPLHLRRRAITSVFVQSRPQSHQKVSVGIT